MSFYLNCFIFIPYMDNYQNSESNTYKKIISATSIFGGVQVINLIVTVIRSKFLAVLIGPAGYGIYGLFNSVAELAKQATGFSLETAGVKEISEAKANDGNIHRKASGLTKLSVVIGVLSILLVIAVSPFLSQITFGDKSKTLAIIWLSISVFFRQVTSGQNAIMQGLSQLGFLAKSSLYGNLIGLLITLPLYYFFSIDAIVPVIIISSVISYLASNYYYKKLKLEKYNMGLKEAVSNGKGVLFFGSLLTLNAFLPALCNYILQVVISKYGTISQVGEFNISMIILNSYIGIIFTVMATEYYPRLVSVNKDKKKEAEAAGSQVIISMLLIVPVIIFFLGFLPVIVKVFFSEEFNGAIPIISWAILGMFFKAISFSLGYVIIARADSRVFIKTAVLFNSIYLLLCISGYFIAGLEGVGIGIMCYFFVHLIGVYLIVKWRYSITLPTDFLFIFCISIALCGLSAIVYHVYDGNYSLLIFTIVFLAALLFSLYEIDKRIRIKAVMKEYFNKKGNGKKDI